VQRLHCSQRGHYTNFIDKQSVLVEAYQTNKWAFRVIRQKGCLLRVRHINNDLPSPLWHAPSSFLFLSVSLARMRNWFSLKSYYWNCSLDNKVKNNTRDQRCSRQWHWRRSLVLRTSSRRRLQKYRRNLVRPSSEQKCRWRPLPDDMKSTHIASRVIIIPTVCMGGPSGRAVQAMGLRPLACWDCRFESHRGHGCLSVVSVVWCQVEVSAKSWSLVQRSPTDCGASLGDLETSWMRRPWPTWGLSRQKQTNFLYGRSQIQIPPGGSLSWLSSVSPDQNGNNIRHQFSATAFHTLIHYTLLLYVIYQGVGIVQN